MSMFRMASSEIIVFLADRITTPATAAPHRIPRRSETLRENVPVIIPTHDSFVSSCGIASVRLKVLGETD